MTVELINPEGLVTPATHAQVAVATGTRTVFVAGQVAQDVDGNVVGAGDLAAQTEQALVNVSIALAAAGATFADVAKTTIYVVDWSPDKVAALGEGLGRVAGRVGIGALGPTTVVGVQALAAPEILVEFDVTAIVD